MANDVFGFALIGCGRIASRHADSLSGAVPGARLVAVCDIVPQAAKALGERHKVPAFSDMHAMMDAVGNDIDVVCLLTESGHHARDCLEVVKYRKHIVVEKPMALTLEDADAMIKACDVAGVRLMVVKQNQFNLPVRKLKEAIDQNRFGKMVMGTVRVRWCRTQEYYDQAPWRGTWALDGGVFSNQASHHIDLLLWCLGEPESVFAKTTTRLVNIEAEDTGVAVIRFRSGALRNHRSDHRHAPQGSRRVDFDPRREGLGRDLRLRRQPDAHLEFRRRIAGRQGSAREVSREPAERLWLRSSQLFQQRRRHAAQQFRRAGRRPGGTQVAGTYFSDL